MNTIDLRRNGYLDQRESGGRLQSRGHSTDLAPESRANLPWKHESYGLSYFELVSVFLEEKRILRKTPYIQRLVHAREVLFKLLLAQRIV